MTLRMVLTSSASSSCLGPIRVLIYIASRLALCSTAIGEEIRSHGRAIGCFR